MVVLMLALELLLSTIGSAIVAIVSFVFTFFPYALALLPLYILYRAARVVWPKLRQRLRRAPKAARAKAPVRRVQPAATLRVRAEAPPPAKKAPSAPPLARLYGEGLDILTRQMRGPLRRGDIPWFLAFGVGGSALLATDSTHVRWPEEGNGEAGSWWFCEGAAVLHVGADSADGTRLAEPWSHLVKAMRKRPMRRPLDGVLLMVGADELRAAAERDGARNALAKRAEAMRLRLRSLHDQLGVVCPVHVVIVRAEALDGFTDLCAAVPAAMLNSVLGWSNPGDWMLPFEPRLVDEAFTAIRGDVALLEADAFASGTAAPRLPLLPNGLEMLRLSLAPFLNSALAGEEGEEPFPLSSIAVTGAYTTATGGRRPAFARDLLPGRAFAQPGYGRPSNVTYLRAHQRRRVAQVALAASVVGLSVAAWQGWSRVSTDLPAVASGVGDLRRALLSRDATVDGPTVGRVIAATALMEREAITTPLLPTSLFGGFDEDKRRLAAATMRRSVLRPIRDALLPSAALADLPSVANPKKVEDLPAFRRLAAQLDRIGGRRDALERYDRFRRSSGFDELMALAGSVYNSVPRPDVTATDGFITRIAAGADLPNLDAKTIAAAVRAESVQLAAPLAEELYAKHPLIVRANTLVDKLRELPQPPSPEEASEVLRLVEGVKEAADWRIASALQAPALGLPDMVKVTLQRAAIADLPGRDTTDRITEALSTAATAARTALLALETPAGERLFTAPQDGGAPKLSPAVETLADTLAAIIPADPPPAVEAPGPPAPPVAQAPQKDPAPRKEEPTPAMAKAEPVAPKEEPKVEPARPRVVASAPADAPPLPGGMNGMTPPLPDMPELPAPTATAHMGLPPLPAPNATANGAIAKLEVAFSQTLAGRFPFVRPDMARGAPDADPQDVRRFFQQLDENRTAIKKAATPELLAFLERMDSARPMLDAVARSAPMSVRFTYGVNRAQEIGAEHIIDWSVRSGTTAVGAAAGSASLVWKTGQPLLLSFRWAAGSPYRPKSMVASEAEAAVGDTVTVVEQGPWALLRLLRGRASSASGSGDGALLRIALPTQTIAGASAPDTVLYMAASVKAGSYPDLSTGALNLPSRFPYQESSLGFSKGIE